MKNLKQQIINTHIFNLITSKIHHIKQLLKLKYSYKDLIKQYRYQKNETTDKCVSNYIWVCWFQGEKNMSPLIKECYRRICNFNHDKKVVLITLDNLDEWISFPDYIIKKHQSGIISNTHFSDLIRFELLKEYGGVWMDITILVNSKIPQYYYSYPIYTGKYKPTKNDYNISANRWTSYFWVSRYPQNILCRFMSDFWKEYWKNNDYLIEYFLIDYVLCLAYNYIPTVKQEMDMIPLYSCGKDPWILLNILSNKYDKEIMDEIFKNNYLQKLSYKGEENIVKKSNDPANCFYKILFLNNKD